MSLLPVQFAVDTFSYISIADQFVKPDLTPASFNW